jgi:hypothetical protein
MNRKFLDTLIDRFLADHRTSHQGGWAKITRHDVHLLRDIIDGLIENKCEEDGDGDYPFQTILVNRRTHEPMNFRPMPYRYQEAYRNGEEVDFIQRLGLLHSNLRVASDRLKTEIDCE